MMIAGKYEEIYPPGIADYVYITDHAYTREELLDMEQDILKKLEFGVHFTSPYRFLERYLYLKDSRDSEKHFAQFLLEGSLV